MKISHIICTRNRAEQLRVTLAMFIQQVLFANNVEMILVDSDSTDDTQEVMKEFARRYPATKIVKAGKGLGRARNAGIDAASGELLTFTDDDCYLASNYYGELQKLFAPPCPYQYGMGQIHLFNKEDDTRIANASIARPYDIKPGTLIPTGIFQGANIFFLREVFAKAGKFRDDMGAGTPFACEDIEFASRVSRAGFTGILTPKIIVQHNHGRKTGSPEADETVLGYQAGRGAYYGCLICDGINDVWKLWHITSNNGKGSPTSLANLKRVENELRGAADYIKHRIENALLAEVLPDNEAIQDSPRTAQGSKG